MTLLQRAVSSCLSLAMSAGLPIAGRRCRSWKRCLISGEALMSLMVLLSFKMMGSGVFGGALIAFQVSERKPGMPASIRVGTVGSASRRRPVATARLLALSASFIL